MVVGTLVVLLLLFDTGAARGQYDGAMMNAMMITMMTGGGGVEGDI